MYVPLMQKGSTLRIISIFIVRVQFCQHPQASIFPFPDKKMWPLVLHDNLQPHIKRRKEADEPATFNMSSSVKCLKCNHWGHNNRTCK